MRVLFLFRDLPYVRRIYAPVVDELLERGHEVHLAYTGKMGWERIERRLAWVGRPGFTAGYAPLRSDADGWRWVAWLVRALSDLARYTHPRYERAPRLRRRVTDKVVNTLENSSRVEPVGRALALRLARRLATRTDAALSARVIRAGSRLEAAIPTSPEIDEFVRAQRPDTVLVTPVVKYGSGEIEYLKSARRLRIPSAALISSWDNLTNKGLIKWTPERVFVWNEAQRREAIEQHGISPDRVVATGGQLFDKWFEQRPSRSREEFMTGVGLDPAEPYVLYLCSSPFVARSADAELEFVLRLLAALRESADERLRKLGLMLRLYPRSSDWHTVDLAAYSNAVQWPPNHLDDTLPRWLTEFYDSLAHSAAVIGINTTAMIEAAIVGKSVLTILEPEFAQEDTLHFHHLLEENGGFLHVASTLDEHLAQLRRVLDEDAAGAERRRRFVESFVRPHGLDRPATPIFVDAVEELATLPVGRMPLSRLLLRPPLAAEARLSALAGSRRRKRGKRRKAQRVRATVEGR